MLPRLMELVEEMQPHDSPPNPSAGGVEVVP
jgi:hypothetical protein